MNSIVRVHIDRQPLESPNPTTGTALYTLGNVPPDRELFREVTGDREDDEVPRSETAVHLTEDEHFYSVREFDIVVNTRKKDVTKPRLTFDEVVRLAYDPVPTGPNILFTITYRHGPRQNPEGEMLEGQSVRLKNGMVFNVKYTDRS
jgi:hypothetical protein